MNFFDIKLYLRYARFLTLNKSTFVPPRIPYDARLFYTVKGEGVIKIGEDELPMTENSLLIINSGVEYHLKQPEKFVTYAALHFDFIFDFNHLNIPIPPEVKSVFNRDKLIGHISFDDFSFFNNYTYISNIEKIEKNLIRILNEYSNNFIGNDLKMSCLLTQILIECARKIKFENDSPENISRKIIKYIQENYDRPLTNIEIGNVFHLHPNHISKLIKQSTGMPLHKYILNSRLIHAIELLEIGNLSIGEIADKCGFCDIYYFSRYFKSVMKMTPSAYMRK